MRTTEIFTVLAAILVLIIMRSKAEPFWPFTSPKALKKGFPQSKPPMGSSAGKGSRKGKSNPKASTAVAGRPGMVYGKRGNAVPKADFDERLGSTRKSFMQDMKYYKTYKAQGNAKKANSYWQRAQEDQETLTDMGYGKRAAGMMKPHIVRVANP